MRRISFEFSDFTLEMLNEIMVTLGMNLNDLITNALVIYDFLFKKIIKNRGHIIIMDKNGKMTEIALPTQPVGLDDDIRKKINDLLK